MAVDVKAAVMKNINELKKTLAAKTSEIAKLEKELKRHETVLALLTGQEGAEKQRNGSPRKRTSLRAVLTQVPDTFTSKEFVKVGVKANRPPLYLRQVLSRWAREGKLKRLERGKYQKLKKTNSPRAAVA